MFGRKGLNQAAAAPGPQAESPLGIDTIEHAQAAGAFFFEAVYRQMASSGDPVCTENFVGLLAAAGGVACISSALIQYEFIKMRPHDDNLLLQQDVDGQSYFIGDLPNRYLLESNESLLLIALNAAIEQGARITFDLPHDAMRHVLQSVGSPAFGVPRLPEEHRPGMLPLELAEVAFPQAYHTFQTCNLHFERHPAAIGFALAKAIEVCAPSLDPEILARIVVEYAVPMAAVDPHRFQARLDAIRANA